MKTKLFLVMLVVFSALIIASGCTGNENSAGSNVNTATQTQVSSTSSGFSLNPTATDKIPSNLAVSVDAIKDPLSGKVTVMFQGGPGQYMTENLNVKIYLSTGDVIERDITPDVNSEAVFNEGTKGSDRVVVVASFQNGESYKIFDELLEYRKRTDNT
ncbi:MAG: hypothetical protein PHV39_07810 [Methanomicrobium sp.]|nr:hypothetical protein [Methanomicrobium sp.]